MARLNGGPYHEVIYCPEEEDWESYVRYHDVNYDWGDILEYRRNKKKAGLCVACEKKGPPIYNHQFLKIPNINNASLYNHNYSLANNDLATSPKKLLNRMEETYWSNWKPNKGKSTPRVRSGRRRKVQKEDREFYSDEDAGQQLIDYFTKKNYSSSTVSVDERNFAKRPIKTKTKSHKTTDDPLIKDEKRKDEKPISLSHESLDQSIAGNKTYSVPSEVGASEQPSHVTIPPDTEGGSTTHLKTFKHVDSFVVTKKKKCEKKEHFQQPKCIKLYRKKPVSGGTYPLGSSAPKQSSYRTSFRLGAPGGSILVTSGGLGNGKRGSRI